MGSSLQSATLSFFQPCCHWGACVKEKRKMQGWGASGRWSPHGVSRFQHLNASYVWMSARSQPLVPTSSRLPLRSDRQDAGITLIPLALLLFIFCFASSLSPAFNIFFIPLTEPLNQPAPQMWRRWTHIRTQLLRPLYSSTSVRLLIPTFTRHALCDLSSCDFLPPPHLLLQVFNPLQVLQGSLLSRRRDLGWVTDSWTQIHEATSGSG